MSDLTFIPFYERGPARPFGLIGKVLVAAALGLTFLLPHAIAVGDKMLTDWSWLLAALIMTAMLALYYATDTLRKLLPGMGLRLRANEIDRANDDDRDEVFMRPLRWWLSTGNFILAGIVVGLINAAVGIELGIPNSGYYTTLFGFFLAGFVCGMATLGIVGVTIAVAQFARAADESFDYTAPDGCGGVQFIGEGLIVFSSVTLVVGVMISVYIYMFPWAHHGPRIVFLQWIWIGLPYALSLVVLLWPAIPLNDALRRYKLGEEDKQARLVAAIRRKLAANPADGAKKELRDDYAFEQAVRRELHAMGTWPHGISANLRYLGIFAANALASASTAVSLYHSTHP